MSNACTWAEKKVCLFLVLHQSYLLTISRKRKLKTLSKFERFTKVFSFGIQTVRFKLDTLFLERTLNKMLCCGFGWVGRSVSDENGLWLYLKKKRGDILIKFKHKWNKLIWAWPSSANANSSATFVLICFTLQFIFQNKKVTWKISMPYRNPLYKKQNFL